MAQKITLYRYLQIKTNEYRNKNVGTVQTEH